MTVKFYTNPYNFLNEDTYQHCSVALAEGLVELGIEFYGNDNYWYINEEERFLIQKAKDSFKETISIYTPDYFYHNKKIFEHFNKDDSKFNILIYESLSSAYRLLGKKHNQLFKMWNDPFFKKFDIVLKCHYTDKIKYPSNFYPWSFGVTNRLINTINYEDITNKKNQICSNFRHPHNLRKKALSELNPLLSQKYEICDIVSSSLNDKKDFNDNNFSYWAQSYHRHDSEYFKLISNSLFSYCFGGIIELKPVNENHKQYLGKLFLLLSRTLRYFNLSDASCYYIYQYDNFRFWESLLAGTVSLHMNFDDWGFRFPINPIDKKHYLGIRGLDFYNSGQDLLNLSFSEIKNISEESRNWTLQNYSPKAVANRLLGMIDKFKSNDK